MAWTMLVVAGLLEICWAIGLKYTDGFSKVVPSVLTSLAIIASMLLLSMAARTIPIGTAYAVWVGIGAFGTAAIGMAFLGEPATILRLVFLGMLVASIVGLKLAS